MLKISLNAVSKRFQKNWVFKKINADIITGAHCALNGANGSGKSTLLRIIAGMQTPTSGEVILEENGQLIPQEKFFTHLSYTAPGMDLINDFTLREFFKFHFSFKKALDGWDSASVIEECGLTPVSYRKLSEFSSGMKQRVKLAQAIFSDTPILLLDEPCTNLDNAGYEQYSRWINNFCQNRLVIIASNDAKETGSCTNFIALKDYQ